LKFTPAMYTDYASAVRGKYRDKITVKPELGSMVTFSHSMKMPYHRWFHYKQGFSPEFVEYCIQDSKVEPFSKILDPFCGVGTTLVTGASMSQNVLGFDILPFAVFISEAKLSKDYDFKKINAKLSEIVENPPRNFTGKWPEVKIIERAFSKDMAEKILAYKEHILALNCESTQRFFLVCLLSIIDKLSMTKKDGGFLRIIDSPKEDNIDSLFENRARLLLEDINNPQKKLIFNSEEELKPSKDVSWSVSTGDARSLDLDSSSIDLILTSPPYLNKTDYTRVYSLELCLNFVEDFQQLRQLRYDSIRGNVEARYKEVEAFFPQDLVDALKELQTRELTNPKHPEMINGYFTDMYLMLAEFHRILKNGGKAYIANWNTRFSGVMFEVDAICAEMAESIGFEVNEIVIARLKGSSTQQVRLYGEKAVRESVLVISKTQH
jgi:DNA modification methylase